MRPDAKKQNNKTITQSVKELGQLCPTVSSKVLRNFIAWRQKRPKQMRVETQEKQPMISIAFNCGMKNGKNQVLEEYLKETIKKSNSSQKMPNAFQKILQNQKRNRFRESPNMTFMSFKTRRTSKESQKKVRTVPSIRSSLQTSFYPRELADLQQQIKDLPSVQERRKTFITLKARSAQKQKNCEESPDYQKLSPQKTYYSQKKKSKNHFFIDRINYVISCTDDLIEDQESISQKNTARKKVMKKQRNHHTQMSVSLPLRVEPTSFYQQEQGNQIVNQLKKKIQIELQQQQAKMNKQILQTEKNALQDRFKYKLSIQRQKYKRNIRSFIKCKQDYRIERRREEVRANGIRRVKKVSNNDKKHKPKPEDD